jgi:hypothetical protein
MSNIDWLYLKRPIIIFFAALFTAMAFAVAGHQYEKSEHEDYQRALSTLNATFRLYRNIVNDIDLLEQYRALYNDYKTTGLVGKERRLSWIESLESTNEVLRLPTLTYSLFPQEKFERPGFVVKSDVSVLSSPMDMSMGLLHEEDLFALLEGLRLSISNLFTVDSCSMNRLTTIDVPLDTKRSNLATDCKIRWVTVDAK